MDIFCESERTYLRKIRISDAEKVACWKDDPLVRKMSVGMDIEITVENQERDIKRSIESPREQYWIIIAKDTGRAIGYIRINWMDGSERFAWLRFGLGEERGKGYAREALAAFVRKLFLGQTHRIDAEVYEFNSRSIRLLESIGFKQEGIRREAYFDGGEYTNVIVFGLLAQDIKMKEAEV